MLTVIVQTRSINCVSPEMSLMSFQSDDAGAALAAAISVAGGAAVAKSEARGNGPLPGGGGLMEEMSALLKFGFHISVFFSADMPRKPRERTNTMNGSKSPVIGRYSISPHHIICYFLLVSPHRLKSNPTPTASFSANGVTTEAVDYDRLKQDILDEMRKELSKLKEELIDAIREELGKSSTA
uniref:VASP tetramerisation domain-containing protein n=1 Tax=Mola mola TaxID=94237 RepID=A0A3Q3X2Y1_MOLML